MYPAIGIFIFLVALRTYGHIEERKAQIQGRTEENKARIYADQRTQQARLDGLTDIRLAGLNAGDGEDNELSQAMEMLGMISPGLLPGMESKTDSNLESDDLQAFSKTEKGKTAMNDFMEWKKENG